MSDMTLSELAKVIKRTRGRIYQMYMAGKIKVKKKLGILYVTHQEASRIILASKHKKKYIKL